MDAGSNDINFADRDMTILLVDDDEIVTELVSRCLASKTSGVRIVSANDGEEALSVLRADLTDLPQIILLDINMPRMDGFEFLRQLRADEQLRDRVVFMMSTSDDPIDVRRAYAMNAAGFIVKSQTGVRFDRVARLMSAYRDCNAFSDSSGLPI